MADTNEQDDEMTPKWHFVLPGQVHQNRWKAGELVELLPGQSANWVGVTLSKGYVTEKGAQSAAERDATVAAAPKPRKVETEAKQEDAPKADAKEVENAKQ